MGNNNNNTIAPNITVAPLIQMPTLIGSQMSGMPHMQQMMMPPAAQQLGLSTNTSAGQPEGLAELMQECGLSQYLGSAQRWCSQNGCIKLSEIAENLEEFTKNVDLKPLEAKRFSKAL